MKRIFFSLLLAVSFQSICFGTDETAIRDGNRVPVELGTYSDETRRIETTDEGYLIVSQEDFSTKVSTGTAGKLTASGNISVTNYFLTFYSFYSTGGTAEVLSSFKDGTTYIPDTIGLSDTLSIPEENPVFQCTLASGATLYYILTGVK